MGDENNQFLTFTLSNEVFALNIATVREVLELTHITKIPLMPSFMRGVINLRGHAVPVIDLRTKFNMEQIKDTINTCIIITEVSFGDGIHVIGALVDSVREVVEIHEEEIEQAPSMGAVIDTEFIKGIGKRDDIFVIILDANSIFTVNELASLQSSINALPAHTSETEEVVS
jgi:purine-binding chemotaxis protein CheW